MSFNTDSWPTVPRRTLSESVVPEGGLLVSLVVRSTRTDRIIESHQIVQSCELVDPIGPYAVVNAVQRIADDLAEHRRVDDPVWEGMLP